MLKNGDGQFANRVLEHMLGVLSIVSTDIGSVGCPFFQRPKTLNHTRAIFAELLIAALELAREVSYDQLSLRGDCAVWNANT
jgi:hypothetical protein